MKYRKLKHQFPTVIICLLTFGFSVWAQSEETPDRTITSLDFQKQRKKAPQSRLEHEMKKSALQRKKEISVVTNPKRVYHFVKRVKDKKNLTVVETPVVAKPETLKIVPPQPFSKTEEIGVTFWRLRPRNENTDGNSPIFQVRLGNAFENWTSARVASTTKFRSDDRVRFTIESSRSGYLYIANREVYADGTKGDAEIIFPTLRTRGGNNQVEAGTLIEIPGSKDSVPYFTVKPRRSDYAGEEIIVLILPTTLSDYEIALRAQPITREKIEDWFAKWGTRVDIYDAEDGEGIPCTQTESEAAAVGTRGLTQEEPLPQTIYKVQVEPDKPLLISFQMQAFGVHQQVNIDK